MPCLKRMVEGRNGISLTTLAGPIASTAMMEAEFKGHIENAMKARHLLSGQNLNVVIPSEIVLLKVRLDTLVHYELFVETQLGHTRAAGEIKRACLK